MKKKIEKIIKNLPKTAGVYLLKDKKQRIVYIGKAKNLKKRVQSHFKRDQKKIFDFSWEVSDIDFIRADNEKEALLIEEELIKKYQPKYNIEWKDQKAYFFVGFSKEDFPRVSLVHQKDKNLELIGPFVFGKELKKLLFDLRKIFPYRSCKKFPKTPCFYFHLNLCLGWCQQQKSKRQKKRYNILIKGLKELLKIYQTKGGRLEGYDISNLSGTLISGGMVVFLKNRPKKSDYRMFKIKTIKKQNDVACLREILFRRLKHKEWQYPSLILLDGGKAQLKAAKNIEIPAISLAKSKEGVKIFSPFSKNFIFLEKLPVELKNVLAHIQKEAHRFALTYHKKRRKKIYDV